MTESQPVTHAPKKHWYDKSYKLLLILPLLLFAVAVIYLIYFYNTNGDIFYKDVSITGGTTITVFDDKPVAEVFDALKTEFPDVNVRAISNLQTGEQKGIIIETKSGVNDIRPAVERVFGFELTQDNSSVEFTGAAISSSFYKQLQLAIIIAFVCMAIVVFVIFRTFIPSMAVIFAALADIIMTIAVVDIAGMNLSLAGIVALLMLIGYSVDTDILLTSRVLKRSGESVNMRIYGSFKTGITMTLTAIVAVGVSLIFTHSISSTLSQIFTILLIGLGFDILNTWLTNASMIKWYAEVKKL